MGEEKQQEEEEQQEGRRRSSRSRRKSSRRRRTRRRMMMMRPMEAEYPGEHNYSRAKVSPVLSLQPKLGKSAPARFQIILGSRVPPGSKREVHPD